ncbi:fatty acid synthase [Trichonephila clavipes]|nr:fatty acid synthase [Trichonephila clavipes]
MENDLLPPNLHFRKPNPSIPALSSGQIRIPTYSVPWKAHYAGISAFGIGGVNVHVVLKSNGDEAKRHYDISLPQLVLNCGRTPENVQYLFDYLDTVKPSREFFALLHNSADSRREVKPHRGRESITGERPTSFPRKIQPCHTRDSNLNPLGYKPKVIATILAGRQISWLIDEI